MIKEFCDICGNEVTDNNQVKISIRCDLGSACGDGLSFSTLHSDQVTLCERCSHIGIPKDTVGIDEDLLQMLKDSIKQNVDKVIEIN